jgi:membrane fusion protein, copper/silver efflux system
MNSALRNILHSLLHSAATLAILLLLIAAIILGVWIGRGPIRAAEREAALLAAAEAPAADAPVQEYTCSMHPQIRLRDPKAKCPICFMDLIPVGEGDDAGERSIVMSESALRLAEIQTSPVVRRFPAGEVRMVGRVDFDETRTASIAAWFPGRIERLHVNFTGTTVQRGQPLAEIYSPELLAAQEELRQTVRALDAVRNGSALVRATTEGTLEAARDKLRLLGLTEEQIRSIEAAETPIERLTIYSPIDGVVVRREALEGRYVQTGEEIYSIADLSHVWVRLEAFESQLPWLRYGQEVTFSSDAFPGETFQGRIAFIDPMLSPDTRTVRVRISSPNPDGRLKPGMFVRSTVRARLAGPGQVVSDELAGRWISPVHPEVIKDEPGECEISGLPLVPAEDFGYVTDLAAIEPPLVIPSTAPLITGRRAVVYVREPGTEKPTFEGREVVLGPRAGNWYIVRSGLREGEQVVVNGAFKIDSSMQLAAKPSMIDPAGDGAMPGHQHGEPAAAPRRAAAHHQQDVPEEFLFSLKPVYGAHLEAQQALAADDFPRFHIAQDDLDAALERVRTRGVVGEPLGLWRRIETRLRAHADHITQTDDIEEARELFEHQAVAMLELADRFGHLGVVPYYRAYCPMAFDDRGAEWLQMGEEIANPYFGASMLRCGEIRGQFDPRGQREIGGRR